MRIYLNLFLLILLTTTTQAQDDFETWPLNGWSMDNGITVTQESNIFYEGSNSASVEVTSEITNNTNFTQNIHLVEDETYTICFHVKNTEQHIESKISINNALYGNTQASNTDWQQICRSFTSSTTGDFPIGIAFDTKSGFDGSEIVYVDNFTIESTLPVVLSDFHGDIINNNINISWTSEEEINHDYYSLEWSTDGINYIEIYRENSFTNSIISKKHNYTHNNPQETNYYRLRMVDKDGKIDLSNILNIKYANKMSTIKVYPTVVLDKLTITHDIDETIQIKIYNNQGKEVFTNNISNNEQVDMSELSPGIYYLQTTLYNNYKTFKIFKQ